MKEVKLKKEAKAEEVKAEHLGRTKKYNFKNSNMEPVKISAADVKKLREATGAGMMDCKKALLEACWRFRQSN